MDLKKLFLSLVLTCSIVSLRAEETKQQSETKAPFVFKVFNNEEECKNFTRGFWSLGTLILISNFGKEQAAERNIKNLPENFREKCNEAINYLAHTRPLNGDALKNEWRTLFFTLNGQKIESPEKYKDSHLLNPDAAILLLTKGADPLNVNGSTEYDVVFYVAKEITGLNFEQSLDKLHAKFECYKKENVSTQDCKDLVKVQTAIKRLKKEQEKTASTAS